MLYGGYNVPVNWRGRGCSSDLSALALVDHIESDRNLQAEALALATHLDHPVYDCLYLVLAAGRWQRC